MRAAALALAAVVLAGGRGRRSCPTSCSTRRRCARASRSSRFRPAPAKPRGEPLVGQKRSFCVEDSVPAPGTATERRYCCSAACGGVSTDGATSTPTRCPASGSTSRTSARAATFSSASPSTSSTSSRNPTSRTTPPASPSPSTSPTPRAARASGSAARGGTRAPGPAGSSASRGVAEPPGAPCSSRSSGSRATAARPGTRSRPTRLGAARRLRWRVPGGLATDAARLKLIVCARTPRNPPDAAALQCGEAVSAPFRIVDRRSRRLGAVAATRLTRGMSSAGRRWPLRPSPSPRPHRAGRADHMTRSLVAATKPPCDGGDP